MGKRVVAASSAEHQHDASPTSNHHITRTIRKRKRTAAAAAGKAVRLSGVSYWHENDYEDSSSNDTISAQTPPTRNQSSKHANNSSILLNSSLVQAGDTSVNESPKPVYTLHPSVVNGTILYDLKKKPWRLGKPIGKGNFGEIFLASDNISVPVTNENAKFVVKIEPHSNGPLFVEIHCLMNTAKKDSVNDDEQHTEHAATVHSQIPPSGIPNYIASGSHFFSDARYRFLVLQRFDRDLHSLIKNCRVHQKSVLTLGLHIVDVLENLHDKGYCHNDVKAQNLMISKCKYQRKTAVASGKTSTATIKSKYDEHYEEKQQTTDSGNSSEQEAQDDDEDFVIKQHHTQYDNDEEDEDFDDGATTNSINSNSIDIYETPINKNRKRRARNALIEFSGSNPVRSCRRQKQNPIYDEMVKSHYLRPSKRISYSEFFSEDGLPVKEDTPNAKCISSDDDSEEFVPSSARRLKLNKKSIKLTSAHTRLTRRQEKLLAQQQQSQQQHTRGAATAVDALLTVEEERIFLIDYGLASKYMDNGVHRPFIMDQRRAHDGTLEFTSRDAHMGAHSRRSDLECLGYNLLFWSQGYLPWKDAATQHQQEKVHRAKEYLMTDVREMLKQIYGKQVPKYLGEFLQQVGQLAYHERPDYARYRRILEREYQQLDYALADMRLDSHEIVRTCVRVKEEIENKNDIFEMNNSHAWSIMKNLSVGTPFHERTLSNRVSPKNLRSKSDKKTMKKKKFSWAEILSQDPDQIARERAEKEFDREEELSETQQPSVRHYEGKPTYAILEIQHRLKMNGRLVEENGVHSATQENYENRKGNEDGNFDYIDDDDDEDDEVAEEEEEEDEEQEENNDGDLEEWEQDEEEAGAVDTETDKEDNEESQETEDAAETDATETSEHMQTNGRTRHTRTTRTFRTTTSNRKTTTKTAVQTTTTTLTRGAVTKRACAVKSKASKLNRKQVSTITTSGCSKRSSSTRLGRKVGAGGQAASAAGEIEHNNTPKYLENGHGHNGNGNSVCGGRPPERRTRRCLIKTDAEVEVEEESNSNFSPDVGSLFNVWKKINNENMYFRGSTAAARHCKK